MEYFNPQEDIKPALLATDLDGTLIPLAGNSANQSDLHALRQWLGDTGIGLIFVTGRPYPSVMRVMQSAKLPEPEWILCDVGTSIYQRSKDAEYCLLDAFQIHLDKIVADCKRETVVQRLQGHPGLLLQDEENQGPHKISYTCEAAASAKLMTQIGALLADQASAWRAMASINPFDGTGLIDILPAGASKAHGLLWLARHAGMDPSALVFSGDSGNDLAALTAGFRAIVVANADAEVIQAAREGLAQRGLEHRLYLAKQPATSGVFEGLQQYHLKAMA